MNHAAPGGRRLWAGVLFFALSASGQPQPADLVLVNAAVHTMEAAQPTASVVAIRGNRIAGVFATRAAAASLIGPGTKVRDLRGAMVLPGFIDGHTHFDRAGALLNDANLLRVAGDEALREEIRRVAALLPPGEWITGGLWGAYEEWAEGAAGAGAKKSGRWLPSRALIDPLTPRHPVFVRSFDGKLCLANSAALAAAALENDPVAATGLMPADSPAAARLQKAVKPKSPERLLNESRAALAELRKAGITEIHDVTGDAQMERFAALERGGELTVRVWMRADLSRAAEFRDRGIRLGSHPKTGAPDPYLRWGAFKGYIDGIMGNHSALFFDSYNDQPGNYGGYRAQTSDDPGPPYKNGNMEKMFGFLKTAHAAGFPANVHAIGDKGTALMLDTFERLQREVGADLGRYRVIHCQVVRPRDFPRFRALGVFAEVNPWHLADDMRWMEERIGKERCRGAYAFRSLLDHGATLVFGSDWPGTNAAYYQVHPKYLLHAAVTRQTVNYEPPAGWYPEQKITMAEALRAYTTNGARAAFEAETRGSLKAGKLADITVLDRDLTRIPARDILKTEVLMTIVDGRIVYEK
jgi:predicted amidohydrolase YtcJ